MKVEPADVVFVEGNIAVFAEMLDEDDHTGPNISIDSCAFEEMSSATLYESLPNFHAVICGYGLDPARANVIISTPEKMKSVFEGMLRSKRGHLAVLKLALSVVEGKQSVDHDWSDVFDTAPKAVKKTVKSMTKIDIEETEEQINEVVEVLSRLSKEAASK